MAKDAPASGSSTANEREERTEEERAVRCARCNHTLTTHQQRIELYGRHAHTFMNPSGVVFDVRLYRDVPGSSVQGTPDSDTSWFPGTAWIYAHCAQCKGHVGWRYVQLEGDGAGSPFFGLIADSIVTS